MSGPFFLVVEGPDGAGKSTLARALAERFRAAGDDPVQVREPGGTPAAEHARAVLLDPSLDLDPQTELLFVTAARAHLVQAVIRPALAAGRVVVSDRYDLSTVAYQGAGRGLHPDVVTAVNGVATGGLQPDLTLVLDVPDEVGRARLVAAGKGRDRFEGADAGFRSRVLAAYRAAAGPRVVHLDGTRPEASLADEAWAAVERARAGTDSRPRG